MTCKGGIPYDRLEGYRLLDRVCRGDHGGDCFLQAQVLLTSSDAMGEGKRPWACTKNPVTVETVSADTN
jgi:hypothetical protein